MAVAAYAEIARLLRWARRRQALLVAAAAAGWGLAGALGWLLAGALALGLGAGPWARAAALAGAALSVAAAAVLGALRLWRTALSAAGAARTVGTGEPRLASDLLSSVELERDRPDLERSGRYSLALLDAHLERTAERALGVDLARAIPARPARRAGLGLACALGAHLLALAAAAGPFSRGWARLARGEPPGPPRRADPITGDVELSYRYPAYMARPERKLAGTGGEISAPPGTEVGLRTRSDRPVEEAQIAVEMAAPPEAAAQAAAGPGAAPGAARPPTPRIYALAVSSHRDLAGRLVVEGGGSYRFRFLARGRVVAEGPPIPIAVEPDAHPEVRISAPPAEVEVDGRARLRVEWSASDDYGLGELALLVKPPGAEEKRTALRGLGGARRTSGAFDLDLAPYRLAEGERLLYWLEVLDNDAISGPKRGASATQAAKIYSEAEHHRVALEKAQALWEEMVRLLGDRLETLPRGGAPAPGTLATGEALDGRARGLHERMREEAAELRRDRGAPREIPPALANAAGSLRAVEQRLTPTRQSLSRLARLGRGEQTPLARQVDALDEEMDRELEKDVLYLEELLDRRRAEDLVRLGRDLAARRRDLASLLDRYRQAPGEEARKEILAEVARLRRRMQELFRRMAELSKGIADEHLNAEALAEMSRSRDLLGGLDRLEERLARGDVEGALRELDAMGSALQQMLASLERAAGIPAEKAQALMREMLEFRRRLEAVEADQRRLAGETERVKGEYRRRVAERLQRAEETARRLEALARRAREEVKQARPGTSLRSEEDFMHARDRLADLERALAMRDFDAALESVRRAMPPMQRLALSLSDEATMAERYRGLTRKDPADVREAARHAQAALPPARQVREELERIFPDPRTVLGKGDQERLERLARRQSELEREAGQMQRQLEDLMRRAPVFPPEAGRTVGESRGHMLGAAESLARRDPQRGHGQQGLALDALERLRRGIEDAARRSSGAGGFSFPFAVAEAGPGADDGSYGDPSRDKVEIPGADAYKVPEEFRKDLLEAMRQGSPETYQSEVKRYYEELVK